MIYLFKKGIKKVIILNRINEKPILGLIMKDMKFILLGLLALCAALTYGAGEEMGTVIGIDLGTTYSW